MGSAQASLLDLDMVLVVNGGIGKAFDELSLNRQLCVEEGVHIRGVQVSPSRSSA